MFSQDAASLVQKLEAEIAMPPFEEMTGKGIRRGSKRLIVPLKDRVA